MGAVRWKHGVSGDWADAGDWRGGKVPGAADNVVVAGAGDFTLTIHSAEVAKALTLDAAGAVVADNAAFDLGTVFSIEAGTFKVSHGGSVDGGTVSIGAAGYVLGSGGSLDAAVVDSGTLKAASGTLTIDGLLTGTGSATAGRGATLDLAGGATFDGDVGGAGTLLVSGSGFSTLAGNITTATVVIETGSILDRTGGGTVSGDISGGGVLSLDGSSGYSLSAGTSLTVGLLGISADLFADGGTIDSNVTDYGGITVTGKTLVIDGTLTEFGAPTIDAGATLVSNGGGTLNYGVAGSGTLKVAGAAPLMMRTEGASPISIDVENGATLQCYGTITGAVKDYGTLEPMNGPLTLDNISGTGTLETFGPEQLTLVNGTTLSETIIGAGTLILEGGAYSLRGGDLGIGFVTVDTTGTLYGSGTIGGSLAISGVVEANGGNLTFGGAVSFGPTPGTLSAKAGSVLDVSAGGSLFVYQNNYGVISGAGTLELGATTQFDGNMFYLDLGTLFIANVLLDSGSVLVGGGVVEGAVDNNGQLNDQGGTLNIEGSVSGTGQYVNSYGAQEIEFLGGGTLSGSLSGGGTFLLGSDIGINDLIFYSGTIVQTENVTIIDSGGFGGSEGDTYDIEAAASTTITLGSTNFDCNFITNGAVFTANGAGTEDVTVYFENNSTASVDSGTLAFLGGAYNTGVMEVSAGVMINSQEVQGTGTLELGAAGTLVLQDGTEAGQVVDFLAASGLLDLSDPLSLAGTITGFGGSDVIDLLNTAETGFSYSGGVLTVMDNAQTVASLHFAGNYTQADFMLASDGAGGTAITFV